MRFPLKRNYDDKLGVLTCQTSSSPDFCTGRFGGVLLVVHVHGHARAWPCVRVRQRAMRNYGGVSWRR